MPKNTSERIIDAGGAGYAPGSIGLTAGGTVRRGLHTLATVDGLGAEHAVFGLTTGQVLRATGAATAAFAAIQDADLPGTIVRTSRTLTAGVGLTGGGDLSADRTFAVGAGLGITVNADDVALTTPGTLTVATVNNSTGNHTHAITSSSNPGAAASILASTAGGGLTLVDLTVSSLSASRLVASDGADKLVSVAALSSWVAGTTNRVTVADDGDGTITLSAPQDIHASATPTFGGIIAPWLRPASDSTTALQLRNSSGTAILTVDTTNGRIGIGNTPAYKLDVTGSGRFTDDLLVGDYLDVDGSAVVGGDFTVGTVLKVNTAGTRIGINREADQQFDLDVAGAIRGQYLVGKHAIQLSSAVGVYHFDGSAPLHP